MRSRGDTGCAIDTWATQPLPKNELSRLWVRSTNWSTSTKVPGGNSSLNEPQARSETGCAIDPWATQPLPKNELSRLWVRSTNWSTSTKVPGGNSSLNEPQADNEIRSVTPARFSTSMLAR